MKRAISAVLAVSLAILLVAAGASTIVVSGQLLAYQDGYVFFTSGDGFRVAQNVVIHDAKTGGATPLHPAPRIWARATFDASGTVTELDLSRDQLPAQGNFADVTHFAVALSSPIPNPDLLQAVATPAPGEPATVAQHFSGRPVLVTFIVQVPPYTPFTSSLYMATDQSGWNAQAIPMDRVDALHYQITRRFNSGTIFRYLYNRGSLQTQEVAQNGLARTPRNFIVTDADVRVIRDTVYAWQDASPGGLNQVQPQIMPTPYNPAPFPNLPPGLPPPQPPPGKKPPPQ
ncbi:MAG TPA: hypothetical protein VHR97_07270 [Candidatus Baltobacteraceae bacterium]|jgi:hypothetical protein|nr:hypothetical protein [Candidatus Baltobacteraceae bacterium]